MRCFDELLSISKKMKSIVIFASGSGSNAENIIRFFQTSETARVDLVLTNNVRAKVLDRCKKLGVAALSFNRFAFFDTDYVLQMLNSVSPDLIVLAGFLWKIPESYIASFPNKIINIHPALLPKFGGKGMYGMHVHRAVVESKAQKTGITIHYVNEQYDEGAIIFQKECIVSQTDSPEDVAAKIHELEMEHFPKVINSLLNG
jgi:phosphoribosylglycinamide formyltransferase-1